MMKEIQVCDNCGGSNVVRDAWAEFDLRTQKWVLSNTFDEGWCEDCEATINPIMKEITEEEWLDRIGGKP